MPLYVEYLRAWSDISTIDECDRAGDGGHQLIGHVVGVDHLRSRSSFGTKDFGDPILLELRLRHFVDGFQHHVSLSGDGCTDKQDDRDICSPILSVTQEYFAHFGQRE